MKDWQSKAIDQVWDALDDFRDVPFKQIGPLLSDVKAILCTVQGGHEGSCATLLKRLDGYKKGEE